MNFVLVRGKYLSFNVYCCHVLADMLSELARREKAAGIKPDADIDVYMKVITIFLQRIKTNVGLNM